MTPPTDTERLARAKVTAQPDADASSAARRLAAVDLGSNSFHMIVARERDGLLEVEDRLREPVRLAMGLNRKRELSKKARRRAWDALERFGERLAGFPDSNVRAVGTNTLRLAVGADRFIRRCEDVLGHPIEVISGQEEARLIYLGVLHAIGDHQSRSLVIDIGGGSTELIVGRGGSIEHARSLSMGCVSFSRQFFPHGRVTKKAMQKAKTAARLRLKSIRAHFEDGAWQQCLGASGTIRAIAGFIQSHGWRQGDIDAKSMKLVVKSLIEAGNTSEVRGGHISSDRLPVFAGGVAVLASIFDDLPIKRLSVSDGALREGLLWDLIGRLGDRDVREATVSSLQHRYAVDVAQATRVRTTAIALLEQVYADWRLPGAQSKKLLEWASAIHEIGIAVAHSGYQRHGAYLIEHANLPGFTRSEQSALAAMVACHRGKFRFRTAGRRVPRRLSRTVLRLTCLLRIAVLLNRSRRAPAVVPLRVRAKDHKLKLEFESGWLDSHPLTCADLNTECQRQAQHEIDLRVAGLD